MRDQEAKEILSAIFSEENPQHQRQGELLILPVNPESTTPTVDIRVEEVKPLEEFW